MTLLSFRYKSVLRRLKHFNANFCQLIHGIYSNMYPSVNINVALYHLLLTLHELHSRFCAFICCSLPSGTTRLLWDFCSVETKLTFQKESHDLFIYYFMTFRASGPAVVKIMTCMVEVILEDGCPCQTLASIFIST